MLARPLMSSLANLNSTKHSLRSFAPNQMYHIANTADAHGDSLDDDLDHITS